MSVSEQLFLPFVELDIRENASENNEPIYLNSILALSEQVTHINDDFDYHRRESEKRHADRRYRMLITASNYYEQGLFSAAMTELQAIVRDLEIAQDTLFVAEITVVIDHCRDMCREKIEPAVVAVALDKLAS
jgi:hypothetical protein